MVKIFGRCLYMSILKRIFIFIALVTFLFTSCKGNELEQALKRRNYDKAIDILKAYVDKEGETGSLAFYYSFLLGKTYFDKGEYEEAIKYLKRAVKIYKEGMLVFRLDYGVDFWIGRSYLELGQYKESIEYLNKATSIAPVNLKTLALNPEYAKEFEENYSEYIPTKDICYKWLATAYTKDNQYQKAIEAFKEALALNPKLGPLDVIHLANISFSHLQLKQYDKALLIAKKAIEIHKLSPIGYFSLARVYLEMKDYDNSIVYLKKAVELDPNNPKLLYFLAVIYTFKNNLEEAMNYLDKIISLYTFQGIGIDFEIINDFPVVKKLFEGPAKREGIEISDKIIKINGKTTKGSNYKEISEKLKGNPGTKVTLTIERKNLENPIDKTITIEVIIDKSAASPLAFRSLLNIIKRNIEEAKKDSMLAYYLDSKATNVKEALAAIYIEQEKYDETLEILSDISEKSLFATLLEATTYAKKNDYKKAIETYNLIPDEYFISQSIIIQNFKNVFLESLKPYINTKKVTAKSFETQKKYQEALNEYLEILKFADDKEAKEIRNQIANLIKKNPKLSEIPEEARKCTLAGEILAKEGKFKEALQEYLKAIKIAPHIAILYKNLALINGELKDYANAIRNMTIYLELMPDAPDASEAKDYIYKWEFMLNREKEK